MRVGVVGPVAPDYFADNVGDALLRMGHNVTQLGSARPHGRTHLTSRIAAIGRQALPSIDERAQQRVIKAALDACCDVIISLDSNLTPGAVAKLKQSGARVAFWFPDAVLNIGRQLMLLAPYDALFFKEPHIVERFQANLDIPVYYLPQGCNPNWHRPIGTVGADPYLVIAGNMYPSRVRLLERLMAKGIPLKLYGVGFPRWIGDTPVRAAHTGRCIFREEKAAIFRRAAGVLNTLHPSEISGVNARLFEAAGCGAAVLTESRPTIPSLFDVGDEVLTFRDFDELVDQASRLLNEPRFAERLGDAASRRAHRDHTYDLRVAAILERVA